MEKYLALILILFSLSCLNKNDCFQNDDTLRKNDSIIKEIKSSGTLKYIYNNLRVSSLDSIEGESFRFFEVSSFGEIEMYQLNHNSGIYSISLKDYWFNYKNRHVDSVGNLKKFRTSKDKWKEVKNLLEDLNFWTLPVQIDDRHYLDGFGYLIEGYNPNKNKCTNTLYHITIRNDPSDTTKYKNVFNKLRILFSN